MDLDLMEPEQSLPELTARLLIRVSEALEEEKPDLIIIQGDTTTVMATAMAAFYQGIRVGHVEAGLRSGNLFSPFPEEMNRRVASIVCSLHFAPTKRAYQTLIREGVPEEQVFLTGNPVIDALHMILDMPVPEKAKKIFEVSGVNGRENDPRLILITAHRRENFGEPFKSLCLGLKALAERNHDIVIVYPVHLNPNVQEPVYRILGGQERIFLTEPVQYDVLAHLMRASYLVLTDSGGIQEEAPSLGKPVLVMRRETERPEGIEAGTAKLVGPDRDRIIEETERLLYDENEYMSMAKAVNPYGDGKAAKRIVDVLLKGEGESRRTWEA
ncbi:MAG: UDP-N-acetylglucosamine 2-epimerase (non-hydrolyzing) [Deltaproteobacteria bacterium]|nr:UDP-N-acetylglucosamine 2-epimerase (non-hydrolyzing) [Deltaproteobacteria bacterium]